MPSTAAETASSWVTLEETSGAPALRGRYIPAAALSITPSGDVAADRGGRCARPARRDRSLEDGAQ